MFAQFSFLFLAIQVVGGLALPQHARVIGRDVALNASYDFVIIGGGTSGLTVADRLTEDPNSKSFLPK